MVTKKDKASIEEMIKRLGVQDFLATVGNILHDKAIAEHGRGDATAVITDNAAEACWKASEQ